ncbi:MAG: FAD-dependent monooxygenase [Burkholderiaceae bacterium]
MIGPADPFDVLIVGAGPAGLTMAALLAERFGAAAHRVGLLDTRPQPAGIRDPRVLALSEASRMRLLRFGFPGNAHAIRHIHVSEAGGLGRVWIDAAEFAKPALGWTVPYDDLQRALQAVVDDSGVRQLTGAVAHRTPTDAAIELRLADGRILHTHLHIDAEGGRHGQALPHDTQRDYGQSALIATIFARPVTGDTVDAHTAFERFTTEGPLALLPMSHEAPVPDGAQAYSVVWCGSAESTAHRRMLADPDFLQAIGGLMAGRVVPLAVLPGRQVFPLGLNLRRALTGWRYAAIGNAAQILHPVAGQGLNLGLRDAQALADRLRPGLTSQPGCLAALLTDYARSRRGDRSAIVGLTDAMARTFVSGSLLPAFARRFALPLLEGLPSARRALAARLLFGA